MNDILTLATLAAAMSELPPKPKWTSCVVRQDRLRFVQRTLRVGSGPQYIGVPVFGKAGQVADCWAFSDDTILRRYLKGELSELDLMNMITTGVCEPQRP